MGDANAPAPPPTDDAGRLSPAFVEWMQGLPEGWVTATPSLSCPAQLTALGNGVVSPSRPRQLSITSPRMACDHHRRTA